MSDVTEDYFLSTKKILNKKIFVCWIWMVWTKYKVLHLRNEKDLCVHSPYTNVCGLLVTVSVLFLVKDFIQNTSQQDAFATIKVIQLYL